MGVFDTDWNAADDMFAEVFGGTVSIHRGALSTSDVTATVEEMNHEIDDMDGVVVVARLYDFAIDAADYTFASVTQTPREGDRIKKDIGGTTHVFEVVPLAFRPCVEPNLEKAQWLIHTKLIGTE